jgi:cytochrome c biogenesis protein CcdA
MGYDYRSRTLQKRKEWIMRKRYRTLISIEYAFVTAIIATFGAIGIAGLFFGFQMGQWTEWQGILVGAAATIAGFMGAGLGLHLSFEERMMRHHRHHTTQHRRM